MTRIVAALFLGAMMTHNTQVDAATEVASATLNVGSKRFTESYILAEIVRQTARSTGEAVVTHRQGLGNTAIVLNALKAGGIEKRINDWFNAVECYPRQLHEMEQADYLTMKRKEYRRQQTGEKTASPGKG